MDEQTGTCIRNLKKLLDGRLEGGWSSALSSAIKEDENGIFSLKTVTLTEASCRRTRNLYVTVQRDVQAIKNEVGLSLVEYLSQRFEVDKALLDVLKPFFDLDKSCDITKIHSLLCSDLDITELALECIGLVSSSQIKNRRMLKKFSAFSGQFNNIKIAMARILAANPHSCDVERLISACNLLKTAQQNSLNLNTENLYLYVYYKMPSLDEFDPRSIVAKWLARRQRRCKQTEKAKEQRWFKGIFKEANSANNEDGEHGEDMEEEDKIKVKIRRF